MIIKVNHKSNLIPETKNKNIGTRKEKNMG